MHPINTVYTVYTVAQLPVGTFDVSVGQNGVHMREISKLPSVAMVTIQTSFSFHPFFALSKFIRFIRTPTNALE